MKAIETRYHGATNTRGSRISAFDLDGNRVTIAYDHAAKDPHRVAAEALRVKMNWPGRLVGGATKRGHVFVFVD